MVSKHFVLNKTDERNRKLWMIAAICSLFIYPIFVFAFLNFMFPRSLTNNELFYQTLGSVIGNFIGLWIFWHRAYRNHGLFLLTCLMVLGPVHMFVTLKSLFNHSYEWWAIGAMLIDIVLYVWWYVLSVKLRKINRKIRMQIS